LRLLGVILAQKQDYSGAAEQFKAYLVAVPGASDAATVRGQLTQLEKLQAEAKQQ
jgi:regulator of sirC expression with transglutaminase-like and TPR domain